MTKRTKPVCGGYGGCGGVRRGSSAAANCETECAAAARMAWWSGARVWTYTRPPFGPRPARPATCATSWNVRSAARKSEMKPRIRVHDAHHGHVREVQPLRDHLRPEQDVDLSLRHALEHPVVRPLGARRIQVHAGDTGLGEPETDEMLELLGPQASHALGFLPAQPADGGNRLLVAAVVAPECGRRLVHRERDGAAGTGAPDAGRTPVPLLRPRGADSH